MVNFIMCASIIESEIAGENGLLQLTVYRKQEMKLR